MGELENGKKDRRIIVEEISGDCKPFGVRDGYRNGCCVDRRWACGNIDSIFSGAGRKKVYCTGADRIGSGQTANTTAKALRQEYRAASELGLPAELKENSELPFPVEAVLQFTDQASFHPLKFLKQMAEKVCVFEQTKVMRAEPHLLVTNRGRVCAKQIVFACHYPFVLRPGYYFLRMHQERSYVIGVKNAPVIQGLYLGIDPDGISLRPAGEVLLFGGGKHRTGDGKQGNSYEYLMHEAEKYFGKVQVKYQWSAQDCMTLDKIAYIGQFGRSTEDWFVATGFQKWGMTSSMAAALILTDLMCDRSNPYAEVFSPQRLNVLASAKTFLEEGKYAAVNLAKEKMMVPKEKLESISRGTGGVVEHEGQKVGIVHVMASGMIIGQDFWMGRRRPTLQHVSCMKNRELCCRRQFTSGIPNHRGNLCSVFRMK